MGLGPVIVDFYSDLFRQITCGLRLRSVSELTALVEHPDAHLFERICAGNILAVLGDKRVAETPDFVAIPAGEFFQGSDVERVEEISQRYNHLGVQRSWIEKEAPKHKVSVRPYFMSRYPVTNYQYMKFLVETGHAGLPSSWLYGNYPTHASNHPVYTVSLTSVSAYCDWLTDKIGIRVRLPTESEWEYAAGNGRSWQYSWGDEFEIFRANTNEMLLQATSPVGVFVGSHNKWGVTDLIGNVEEFVSDNYTPYPGAEIVEDDLFLKLGHYRIAKGGAFNRFSDLARVQRRHGAYPSSLYAIGFRVAHDH